MTDEEKQAIEYFENKLQELKEEIKERQNDEFKGYGTLEDIAKLKYCNLHTMLNLIEKQQAEIRQYDKALHDQIIKDYDMEVELKAEIEMSNEVIHKRNEEKLELASMCLKKNKIIDEMIYYLSDFDIDEMCEQCECCIGNGCHADDDVEFKMRCIKEYFKKKVEDK